VLDEALGGQQIEIVVVDDRDVARMEASDQILRPAIEPRGTADPAVEQRSLLGRWWATEQPERHA
jgi:hypothetical protein